MKEISYAINKTKYFLLDMDGTVYVDDAPIGDVKNTLQYLRARGKKIVYLTNNSSRSKLRYEDKLKALGLYSIEDVIYTSGMATAAFVAENYRGKKVCLLGTDALAEEFSSAGIVLDDDNPDLCVLGYDTQLTYEKLRRFTVNLRKGLPYVASHPDVNCPSKDGLIPDAGAFMEMIFASTGRRPQTIVGKPYKTMGETLVKRFNASRDQFMMIGDRLNTDIQFGLNCKFWTTLVLSGETTMEMADKSTIKPDFILEDINRLVDKF